MTLSACAFVGGPLHQRVFSIPDDRLVQQYATTSSRRVYYPDELPMARVTFTKWTYRRVSFYRFDLVEEEAEP